MCSRLWRCIIEQGNTLKIETNKYQTLLEIYSGSCKSETFRSKKRKNGDAFLKKNFNSIPLSFQQHFIQLSFRMEWNGWNGTVGMVME
ncbi:hypothetical protein BpHYR1_012233 [Brachionus plicatilis]|uniref:Uncharacterized protein n=1 Tax=Brachionus plicatilis TaxID=10195 RepID=A0A3M7PL59_BRAPC|nr:hypothetical protein BpHYR1_012233 [Brachionus plicatilis]